MSRFVWKEGAVISLKTMDGMFTLAQTLKSPYIIVYALFSTEESWGNIGLREDQVLSVYGVTKQFMKYSFSQRLDIQPLHNPTLPTRWISVFPEAGTRCIWQGTPLERTILYIGKGGGSLIERDITLAGDQNEKVLISRIPLEDTDTIDRFPLTSLGTSPELNERLYLSYCMGRCVDPMKDLIFGRPLPIEYKRYFEILSA